MKIRIEVIPDLAEDEVIIRCGRADERIDRIQHFVLEQQDSKPKIAFYKDGSEFYFPLEEVLFFETEGEYIYAHTREDAFRIKSRLYELESSLPRQFARAAKSCIINISQVRCITRNLTASSLVQFKNSHKQIYVSRHYYSELRDRLNERSLYEK